MTRGTLSDDKSVRKHASARNRKPRYQGVVGAIPLLLAVLALVSLYAEVLRSRWRCRGSRV